MAGEIVIGSEGCRLRVRTEAPGRVVKTVLVVECPVEAEVDGVRIVGVAVTKEEAPANAEFLSAVVRRLVDEARAATDTAPTCLNAILVALRDAGVAVSRDVLRGLAERYCGVKVLYIEA